MLKRCCRRAYRAGLIKSETRGYVPIFRPVKGAESKGFVVNVSLHLFEILSCIHAVRWRRCVMEGGVSKLKTLESTDEDARVEGDTKDDRKR